MRLEDLNAVDRDAAARALLRCCASPRWAQLMADSRPLASLDQALVAAERCWQALDTVDWLDAFAGHPEIGAGGAGRAEGAGPVPRGATASAGREASGEWPAQEQAGVAGAAEATLLRLAAANHDYQARFGYIFIICATGKSAAEMLALLERRMGNHPDTEMRIAADEQRKITRLRLTRLVEGQDTSL